MRWATVSAWALPVSDRCRPGARPGRRVPVVGVRPCRTSSTRVGGGGLVAMRASTYRRAGPTLEPTWTPWRRWRRRSRPAGRAPAWSSGASRWPGEAGGLRRLGLLGPSRPRLRRPRRPGSAIVGLAPAAHGANRTGRMFTGDRSGDFLYAALHRTGFANQPTSDHRGDGLALTGACITAPVRCAPPANKPTPDERDTCRPWLERELALLPDLKVFVVLGQFAYQAHDDPPRRAARDRSSPTAPRCLRRRLDDPLLVPRQPAEHLHRESSPSRCSMPS